MIKLFTRLHFILLINIFVLLACDESDNELTDPSVLQNSDQVKTALASLNDENILLVKHSHDEKVYRLILENDDTLKIASSVIVSLTQNLPEWSTAIQFSDGTSVEAPTLGNELTIAPDSIILNPSWYSPLSALIKVPTKVKGRFNLKVAGKNGVDSDLTHSLPYYGAVHRINIFGLYGNHENTVEITFKSKSGKERIKKEIKITTGILSEKLPEIIVDVANRSSMEEGLTLVSYRGSGSPNMPFIMDSFGDIRWYLDYSTHPTLNVLAYDNGLEQLKNGNFYLGDIPSNKIYELDFFGNTIHSWDMPGYKFHHNVLEKPNGNFLATVSKEGSKHLNGKPTINDYIIEINRSSGAIVTEWDLKLSLDENRTTLMNTLENANVNWIHVNGIIYDENDNTIILSGRVQGTIKVDASNNIKWIISPHTGWGTSRNGVDLNSLLLKPLSQSDEEISTPSILAGIENHTDFEWGWYQHAPLVMPNGNVMIFDNGDNRNFTGVEKYSRGVEFKIDEENRTIKQIWQYGKERGIKTYSRILSDVDYLPGKNNVLFCPGWNVDNEGKVGGKVIEVNYLNKEVVFEVRITPPSGPQTLHRAERIKLY